MPGFRLYLITDRRQTPDLAAAVAASLAALPPGAAAVQLREKDLSAGALLALTEALLPICRRHRAPLLINDRLDVALAAGADGVHLGGRSVAAAEARRLLGPAALIGVSCHSLAELGATWGADFATYSPIFASPGKGPAIGVKALREAAAASPLPLFALGGIDASSAPLVFRAGAHGVAAIRSWLEDARGAAKLHAAVVGG